MIKSWLMRSRFVQDYTVFQNENEKFPTMSIISFCQPLFHKHPFKCKCPF